MKITKKSASQYKTNINYYIYYYIYVCFFAYLVRSTSEGSDGDDRIGTIRCHTSKIMIANFLCLQKKGKHD